MGKPAGNPTTDRLLLIAAATMTVASLAALLGAVVVIPLL